MKHAQRGFTLLISVIFMSVMLSFGLTLGALGYKQQILASSAIESQYAFYAADAALECALYADQRQDAFAYARRDPFNLPLIACDGGLFATSEDTYTGSLWKTHTTIPLDGARCAMVTVYKYSAPQAPENVTTYIFSQGYDVSCATVANPGGARFVSRGLQAHY